MHPLICSECCATCIERDQLVVGWITFLAPCVVATHVCDVSHRLIVVQVFGHRITQSIGTSFMSRTGWLRNQHDHVLRAGRETPYQPSLDQSSAVARWNTITPLTRGGSRSNTTQLKYIYVLTESIVCPGKKCFKVFNYVDVMILKLIKIPLSEKKIGGKSPACPLPTLNLTSKD